MINNRVFNASLDIMRQISQDIHSLTGVNAYIAGGMAVSYWLGEKRITYDVDAVFSHRMAIPNFYSQITVDGRIKRVIFDHSFNGSFFFLSELGCESRASDVAVFDNLNVKVFLPVDLVVFKTMRMSDIDKKDIELLIAEKMVGQEQFYQIFQSALKNVICNLDIVNNNYKITMDLFNKYSSKLPPISGHCVSLDNRFSHFHDLLEEYADGCPNVENAREREAIAVSVIYAVSHPERYLINFAEFANEPEACSRLLYACLMASGFQQPLYVDEYLDKTIEFMEKHIGKEQCDLFLGMGEGSGFNLEHPEQMRARIKTGLLYSDVAKALFK